MPTLTHRGIGVSPGIAVGTALVLQRRLRTVPHLTLAAVRREAEIERLERAAAGVRAELTAIEERAVRELGSGIAQIIDAQLLMLDDRAFLDAIRGRIATLGRNAEWATKEVGDDLSARFAQISDAYVRERGNDVDDLASRLLRKLCGVEPPRLDQLQEPTILIAYDLSPADTAVLDRDKVIGFATEVGGSTSHTAIMARSLEIPAVAGVHELSSAIASGDLVILDGSDGEVIVGPEEPLAEQYRLRQERQKEDRRRRLQARQLPSVTPDGFEVTLLANIESAEEADLALQLGAAGVGLYRSEFLYLRGGAELPGEEDHVREYRDVLKRMAPRPVAIRTLDLGGDKDLPGELSDIEESNALLGLRAIRRSLRHPEIFETQLRALLRASTAGNLRIVLPFISSVDELREAKQVLQRVRRQLLEDGESIADDIGVGVMLEVPSAALIIDHLAEEGVDFFAVGTNDLIQYVLAVDRTNEAVADMYQPLHPAVLRLLDHMVRAAQGCGVPLSICGEVAADPLTALVLLGLGVQELSMVPGSLAVIRNLIRSVPLEEARELVAAALRARTAAEVEELALARLVAHFPDGLGNRT